MSKRRTGSVDMFAPEDPSLKLRKEINNAKKIEQDLSTTLDVDASDISPGEMAELERKGITSNVDVENLQRIREEEPLNTRSLDEWLRLAETYEGEPDEFLREYGDAIKKAGGIPAVYARKVGDPDHFLKHQGSGIVDSDVSKENMVIAKKIKDAIEHKKQDVYTSIYTDPTGKEYNALAQDDIDTAKTIFEGIHGYPVDNEVNGLFDMSNRNGDYFNRTLRIGLQQPDPIMEKTKNFFVDNKLVIEDTAGR